MLLVFTDKLFHVDSLVVEYKLSVIIHETQFRRTANSKNSG